jgi:hypothetical protein
VFEPVHQNFASHVLHDQYRRKQQGHLVAPQPLGQGCFAAFEALLLVAIQELRVWFLYLLEPGVHLAWASLFLLVEMNKAFNYFE